MRKIGLAGERPVGDSRVYKASHVFPSDLNHKGTLYGGKILAEMDVVGSMAAVKHARHNCVTASIDWVDFLCPVHNSDSICYEAFVIWTGNTSMEVFVKAIAEDLKLGTQRVAATSFITFVALGEDNAPAPVPKVVPETEEEKQLHAVAMERAKLRHIRKEQSEQIARTLSLPIPEPKQMI
ncbi:acyl-CoA thioesterase [Ectobacillus ponti]|uniref:Acyl-CoA thioesterase n=1 Tax=Ectobacillus ponti TaxID=2961894 RepID=A0AA42BPL5_9BACI|nr:acyl-CoA thioesterase [Ectobacillus ponti]MCP8967659.1 acyl-CoA thioesterase [Ectobacillus ponti]